MKLRLALIASCFVLGGGLAPVAIGCSSPPSSSGFEPVGSVQSAVTFLTREIDGTVRFTNVSLAPTPLDTMGIAGGSVGGTTIASIVDGGSGTNPNLPASGQIIPASPDLSATYAISAPAPECGAPGANDFTWQFNASVSLALPGGGNYFIPGPSPINVCQNPGAGALPAIVPPDVTSCAAIVNVTFTGAISGASVVAYDQDPTVLAGLAEAGCGTCSQANGNYGGGPAGYMVSLPVNGDVLPREIDVTFTTGTSDFVDKIHGECKFTGVVAPCDQAVPLTCNVPEGADGGLNEIIGQVDMVGEFLNPIASAQRTFVFAGNPGLGEYGPLENYRFYQVLPQDGGALPGSSAGSYVLENLLPSSSTSPATPWPVGADMSLRNGQQTEYFLAPQLADSNAAAPNAAVPVPLGPPVDLGKTFVMQPAYIEGDILLDDLRQSDPCLQNIYRASDPTPGPVVPGDWSLGSSSFVHATGLNDVAPGAARTAFNGGARVLFGGGFDPLSLNFVGAYQFVLGLLNNPAGSGVQAATWQEDGLTLVFLDPQEYDAAILGMPLPASPARSFQNENLSVNDTAPFKTVPPLTPLAAEVHPIHYCFGSLTIDFQNIGASPPATGAFYNPTLNLQGSFSGTDFQGNPASYTSGANAYGIPATQAAAATNGSVFACVPAGLYTVTPSTTNIDGNNTVSQSSLQNFSKQIDCGDDAEVTPPLGVVEHVPQCVTDGGTTIPVSADVTSVYATSNPATPNVSVDSVTVTVNDVPLDGGAPIPISGADLCAGVDAGGPASCGNANPGACGCTPETLPIAPTTVAVGNCVNTVKVTAVHNEVTEDGGISAAASSDTRTVIVDPNTPVLSCPDSVITVSVPPGQSSVPVNYGIGVSGDPCNPQPDCSVPSGSAFFAGSTTQVTCTANAYNGCNPSNTCTFTVKVNSTCPVLACPPDTTVSLSSSSCTETGTYAATLTDTCAGTPPTQVDPQTVTVSTAGTTTVTYTSGALSCTQHITANAPAPVITTQPIGPIEACGPTLVTLPLPLACDACSPTSPTSSCQNPVAVSGVVTWTTSSGGVESVPVGSNGTVTLGPGNYTVTWTATVDGVPTTATQSFSVSGPSAPPWSAGQTYHNGDRTTFEGVIFEAYNLGGGGLSGVAPTPPNTNPNDPFPGVDATLAEWRIPVPCGITPWLDETHYLPGSIVTFGGESYTCLLEHVAVWNWTPLNFPAGWRRTGGNDEPICPCGESIAR